MLNIAITIAAISGVFLVACAPQAAPRSSPQSVSASVQAVDVEGTITTSRGTISVPGSAFIDGTDANAIGGPLTLLNINIWNDVPRQYAVCQLTHGTEVAVEQARLHIQENRHYFLVRGSTCLGWVPETLLSTLRKPIIGDII